MFMVQIPMIAPLKHVNMYVVRGFDENLIIDAGPPLLSSKIMLFRNLRGLKVSLNKSVFLATHSHADHFGLIERLAGNSKIYIGHREMNSLFRDEEEVKKVIVFAVENGFPEHSATLIARFMFKRYSRRPLELVPLKDGDILEIGDYKFKCIESPGHTWGHICLYDQERRLLISGDHVLSDITPGVFSWSYDEDTLSAYLSSLRRTYELNANLVLPGHGRIFMDLKRRVIELINHYKLRLLEVISVLSHRIENAYWIASKVKWGARQTFWSRMLNVQRWLVFGETLACLNFLTRIGILERKMLRGRTLYSVADANAAESLNDYFLRFYNVKIT